MSSSLRPRCLRAPVRFPTAAAGSFECGVPGARRRPSARARRRTRRDRGRVADARRGVRIHTVHVRTCTKMPSTWTLILGVILASPKAASRRPCGRDLWGLAPRCHASAGYWTGRMSAERAGADRGGPMSQTEVERTLGGVLADAVPAGRRVSFLESSWRRTSSRRCFECHADDWGPHRQSSTTGSGRLHRGKERSKRLSAPFTPADPTGGVVKGVEHAPRTCAAPFGTVPASTPSGCLRARLRGLGGHQ